MFSRVFVALAAMLAVMATRAYAGTGGTEFQEIYTTITDWSTGFLGKTMAAGLFLSGMAVGIIRQSLWAIVIGIAGGMAVNYTPAIIDSVVTALI